MRKNSAGVWWVAGAFVALVSVAGAAELVYSYKIAVQTAYERSNLPGYLISEWIAESFQNVEMVLRESLAGFNASNLVNRERSDEENEAINKELVRRAAMHGHMVFLGIFDRDCVIQFGSVDSIIGDSSAELGRAYCTAVREPPVERLKLSGFFVSSTGEMNVSATYPLLSAEGEVIGFALAGLDLSFFQRWLGQFDDPTVTITIMDAGRVLLARRPESADLGRPIEDGMLEEFISSDEIRGSFRRKSPVDGIDRIWTLRKTRELPFIIATGYAVDDVLSPWYAKLTAYLIGILLLAAISVALAFAYRRNQTNAVSMELLAMNDQLTGLMNRRSFDKLVRGHVEHHRNQADGAAFIMIDVDHFKEINDRHGHETGDRVLKEVSESIRSNFRSSDLVCRWGGEEYLTYLPGTDLRIAIQLAQRLKEKVEGMNFVEGITVTVSAGIALLEGQDALEDVIRRADEKLYEAKRRGRNRVCY